jgi:hypothetical protein
VSVAGYTVNISQAAGLPSGAVAVVSFHSDPGDYVGQGLTVTHIYTSTQFQVGSDAGHNSITFSTINAPGVTSLGSMTLAAPAGQALTPGTYEHTQRWPLNTPGQPGLDIGWDSNGCNKSTGRFAVGELAFAPDGSISRLHASFEQHCERNSPALRGSIWIDAGGSTNPPTPPALPVPATPTTIFTYVSDPNDAIGGGATETLALANTIFTPLEGQGVSINMRPIVGINNRQIAFRPASTTPQVGTYSASGVSLIGFGPCNSLTGTFTVLEASYGTQGDVYRFHATFDLHCGAALSGFRGEVFIVADPWR